MVEEEGGSMFHSCYLFQELELRRQVLTCFEDLYNNTQLMFRERALLIILVLKFNY